MAPKRKAPVLAEQPSGGDALPELSRYQAFTMRRMDRAQLKDAPYNPRIIDPLARRKLAQFIKEDGLLGPMTWNQRTGFLVGGHKRLAALDALHDGKPYSLDVAVVDKDDKSEKRSNIKLNNPGIQGVYDLDPLADLLKDVGAEAAGFDKMDLELMGYDDPTVAGFFQVESQPPSVLENVAELQQAHGKGKAAKKQKKLQEGTMWQMEKAFREGRAQGDDVNYYAIVICPSVKEQTALVTALGADPNARNLSLERLLAALLPEVAESYRALMEPEKK